MKILFTRFPLESAHGGAEQQTLSLMKGLRDRGHAVAFLGSCPTLLVVSQQHQLPSASLDIGPPPVSKETLLSFPFRKKRMADRLLSALRQFKDHGLDAIFMLSLSEKILLTEPALEMGVKVFWIEHDTIGPWLSKNPYRKQLVRLSKQVTTIGVSKLSREKYLELGWDPLHTIAIPNGIDPHRFTVSETEEPQPRNHVHVGCVARLAEEKGVDLLIEAISNIPSVTLSIVGMGREKKALEKMIAKYDLGDRITIEARKGNMGAFYRSCDIFVLPSRRHDPYGLVAAEAMMLGVPVVVTDACGIALQLSHAQDSMIATKNSAESLEENISALVSDDEYRQKIAEAGRHKAQQEFTLRSMIDQYEALLK